MEPTSSPALPPPEELRRRGLFAYHDGFRPRLADVIQVNLRMQEAIPGGDMAALDEILEVIAAGAGAPATPAADGEEASPGPRMSLPTAMVRLANLVGAGFDLPPLDEATARGLSIQERVDLMGEFVATAPVELSAEEGGPEGDAPAVVAPGAEP